MDRHRVVGSLALEVVDDPRIAVSFDVVVEVSFVVEEEVVALLDYVVDDMRILLFPLVFVVLDEYRRFDTFVS